jgi:hypothetical protein
VDSCGQGQCGRKWAITNTKRLLLSLGNSPEVEGLEDDHEKQIEAKAVITLENKKIFTFKMTLMIEGKKVAVRNVRVTEEIQRPNFSKLQ